MLKKTTIYSALLTHHQDLVSFLNLFFLTSPSNPHCTIKYNVSLITIQNHLFKIFHPIKRLIYSYCGKLSPTIWANFSEHPLKVGCAPPSPYLDRNLYNINRQIKSKKEKLGKIGKQNHYSAYCGPRHTYLVVVEYLTQKSKERLEEGLYVLNFTDSQFI